MKKTIYLCFMVLWCTASMFSQKNQPIDRETTVYLAGSYSLFKPRFEIVDNYGDDIITPGVQFGLGYKDILVIGKFHRITATGKSKVVNIKITTTASWNQDVVSIGLRKCAPHDPVYYDLLYLITKANESIGTINPVMPTLASTYSIKDSGIAFAVGYNPELFGLLGIFLEVQWNYMFREEKNEMGNSIPNLGGFFITGGLQLTIY